MFRAIVFDFDGLICDTEQPDLQTWSEIFEEHGAELPLDWWNSLIGTADGPPPWELLQEMVGPIDVDAVRHRRLERYLELTDAAPLQAGVLAWLAEAKDRELAIGLATSAPTSWIERHLPRLGIEGYFDCVRTRDDVPRAKPWPDVYVAALDALRVGGQQAIAVEDSPNGARAARAAGMRVVAVPNALTADLEFESDLRLPSLADASLEEVMMSLDAPDQRPGR